MRDDQGGSLEQGRVTPEARGMRPYRDRGSAWAGWTEVVFSHLPISASILSPMATTYLALASRYQSWS